MSRWRLPSAKWLSFLCLWILYSLFLPGFWMWLFRFSSQFHLCGLLGYLCCWWLHQGICRWSIFLVLHHLTSGYFFLTFPFLITLHFAAPNFMWYLSATWLVTSSTSDLVPGVLVPWIFHLSGQYILLQIRHLLVLYCFPIVFRPSPCCFSSLDISSIRTAYSMTDRTPHCLILSLILIFHVGSYLVCIFCC